MREQVAESPFFRILLVKISGRQSFRLALRGEAGARATLSRSGEGQALRFCRDRRILAPVPIERGHSDGALRASTKNQHQKSMDSDGAADGRVTPHSAKVIDIVKQVVMV